MGIFHCFNCYLFRKRNDPSYYKATGDTKYMNIDREWLEPINKYEQAFFPQMGDEVYYFFQGHEEFLVQFFDWMCWEQNEEILPNITAPNLWDPTLCKVKNIAYEFPRTKDNIQSQIKVVVAYTLVICDQKPAKEFIVKWFHSYQCDPFLIPKHIYENVIPTEFLKKQKLKHIVWQEKKLNELEMYYLKKDAVLLDVSVFICKS